MLRLRAMDLRVLDQLRFQYVLALFQTAAQSTVAHDSEIVLHTRQGVDVADPMLQCVSRVNICSSLP